MQEIGTIFIRESNGLSYQHPYDPDKIISQLLTEIFKKQISNKLRALSKGRLLEMNQTLQQNNVKPSSIIHLLTLSREEKESGTIYLSFDNKIYRLPFVIQETVRDFKKLVQQETGVQAEAQIILFNSIQLENSKSLKDYELRNGDFLCMAEMSPIKPHILDIHHVIFPKKNFEKRRGSECTFMNQGEKMDNRERRDKLFSSAQNILSHSLQYGSIRLSDNNSSDQIRLPQTISEQFIQQTNYTQQNSKQENEEADNRLIGLIEKGTGLASTLTLFPDLQEKVGLCESYNYEQKEDQDLEDFDNQPTQLQQISRQRKIGRLMPEKISPKIVNSVEIESPPAQIDGQIMDFSI